MLRKVLSFRPTTAENTFIDWCSKIFVSDAVLLKKSKLNGFGLFANNSIRSGSELLKVPTDAWQPYSADYSVEILNQSNPQFLASIVDLSQIMMPQHVSQANSLVKSVCLSLNMMNESARGIASPYINLLRTSSYPLNIHAMPHPLLMEKGVHLDPFLSYLKIHKDIMLRRNLYDHIGKVIFKDDEQMINEFKWAIGTILSRGISGQANPFTLVPVLDFVNHSCDHNAEHAYDVKEEAFRLVSTKHIIAGEEITINYGPLRDTSSFMSMYGFLGHTHNVNINSSKHSVSLNGNNMLKSMNISTDTAKTESITSRNPSFGLYNSNDQMMFDIKLPDLKHIVSTTLSNNAGGDAGKQPTDAEVTDVLIKVMTEIQSNLADKPTTGINITKQGNVQFKFNQSSVCGFVNGKYTEHDSVSVDRNHDLRRFLSERQQVKSDCESNLMNKCRSDLAAFTQICDIATIIHRHCGKSVTQIPSEIVDVLITTQLKKYVTHDKLKAFGYNHTDTATSTGAASKETTLSLSESFLVHLEKVVQEDRELYCSNETTGSEGLVKKEMNDVTIAAAAAAGNETKSGGRDGHLSTSAEDYWKWCCTVIVYNEMLSLMQLSRLNGRLRDATKTQ